MGRSFLVDLKGMGRRELELILGRRGGSLESLCSFCHDLFWIKPRVGEPENNQVLWIFHVVIQLWYVSLLPEPRGELKLPYSPV
jgi:hypothetical protein